MNKNIRDFITKKLGISVKEWFLWIHSIGSLCMGQACFFVLICFNLHTSHSFVRVLPETSIDTVLSHFCFGAFLQ